MSVPAFVTRVARPSEATAFARSAYITDIIFFMLCAIATVVSSALVKILPPQQCDRPGRLGRLSAKEPMKGLRSGTNEGYLSGGGCSAVLSGAYVGSRPVEYAGGLPRVYAGSPFKGLCRVSGREGLCGVSFREHHLCVLLVPYAGCLQGCPSGCRCHRSS